MLSPPRAWAEGASLGGPSVPCPFRPPSPQVTWEDVQGNGKHLQGQALLKGRMLGLGWNRKGAPVMYWWVR